MEKNEREKKITVQAKKIENGNEIKYKAEKK